MGIVLYDYDRNLICIANFIISNLKMLSTICNIKPFHFFAIDVVYYVMTFEISNAFCVTGNVFNFSTNGNDESFFSF